MSVDFRKALIAYPGKNHSKNSEKKADDLVIFSRSANGLQTPLNKLEFYSEKTELTVNLDKTKV